MLVLSAIAVATAGGVLLYLASPNQKLATRPGPGSRNATLGAALIGTGLALLLTKAGPVTAVFSLLTLMMALMSALPFLAHLRRLRGGRK